MICLDGQSTEYVESHLGDDQMGGISGRPGVRRLAWLDAVEQV
jgi:hypothetical protein